MTTATPFELHRIKIKGQLGETDGVRTRNTWNAPWTGTFLAYDQDVESASPVVWLMCSSCVTTPFRVTQQEIDDAGGFINCEYCGNPCYVASGAVYP